MVYKVAQSGHRFQIHESMAQIDRTTKTDQDHESESESESKSERESEIES